MAKPFLDTCRAKRDFDRTAGPVGGATRADGNRLVARKRHASWDHYELRL